MADGELGRSMSIGAVFERNFGVMRTNPLVAFGPVFVFAVVPQMLVMLILQGQLTLADDPAGVLYSTMAYFLIALVLTSLTQGALTRATVAFEEGEKAGLGDCLAAAFARIVPIVVLSVLLAIGVWLGFLLLLVPGVILALMWSVAIPALVEEDLGVFEALSRSVTLTKGSRWKIFGLFLAMLAILLLISLAFGIAVSFIFGAILGQAGMMIVQAVSSTFTTAFWVLVQTSLYVELRQKKDGPTGERLAEVFA